MEEIIEKVQNWAKEKGLNDPEKQYLKVLEEIGETAGAILKGKPREEILNEIGDISVTVIIYAYQNDLSIEIKKIQGCYGMKLSEIFIQLHDDVKQLTSYILEPIHWIALSQDSTLEECLTLSWNKIKERKGKTIAGNFVKDSDLSPSLH